MKKVWQDTDIQKVIGNLLRYGVLASSAVIILGGIVYLIKNGSHSPDYSEFRGIGEFHSLSDVFSGIAKGRGEYIIQFGVLLLVMTPIARIMFSIFAFLQEKDRLYVAISSLVLLILVGSMLLGLHG